MEKTNMNLQIQSQLEDLEYIDLENKVNSMTPKQK